MRRLSTFLLALALTSQVSAAPARQAASSNPVLAAGALGRDVDRVASAWRRWGSVTELPARFLQRGETIPVPLPPLAGTGECITLLALASRNLSFVLSFAPKTARDGNSDLSARAFPVQSTAGVAEITRCGPRRAQLPRLRLDLRSARGTVQFLVARGDAPAPAATDILSSRKPGPLAEPRTLGARARLGPLEQRLARRTATHRTRGALSVKRLSLSADTSGRGVLLVPLKEGCHRVDVLAGQTDEGTPDIDARLLDPSDGRLLALDANGTSDPKLLVCQTLDAPARLEFLGAAEGLPLTALVASWPLPRGLPLTWGHEARSAMARALFTSELGPLSTSEQPIHATLGTSGLTHAFVEVEPDACYRLALAPFVGESSQLGVGVSVGPLIRQAQANEQDGSQLSFCSPLAGTATLEVQAQGNRPVWLLAVWRLPPFPGDAHAEEESSP